MRTRYAICWARVPESLALAASVIGVTAYLLGAI